MKIKHSNVVLSLTAALALTMCIGCIWPFAGGEKSRSTTMDQETDTSSAEKEEGAKQNKTAGQKSKGKEPEVLYRVSAGADEAFESPDGNTWKADKLAWKGDGNWGAEGGKTVNRGGIEIRNTRNDNIFRTERWGMPGYKFKVPNGTYRLNLYFSEGYHAVQSAGTRIFTVNVEGKEVLRDFDIYKEAGFSRRTAVARTIDNISVEDGELNITFDFQKLTPVINGIEVIRVN